MAVNLTAGAVSMLSSGEWQTMDLKPVLQVMDVRTVQTQSPVGGGGGESKERYRVLLSDGSFHQQGMLATQLNGLVRSQQLQKGSIVHLTEFVCNAIRDRIIVIIINLDVILGTSDIIGDPKPFQHKLPGQETPLVERSAVPMESSLNQPATTVTDAQLTTRVTPVGTITRPNYNVGPTTHTSELQHNAGPMTRPNFNVGPTSHTPVPKPNAGLHSYNNSLNSNSVTNVGRPIQPAFNQVPPMYGNRGPIAKNEAPARIIPIAALNPYQGKWTIKARVTAKSELRRYNNAKGDGKVFSFDLVDSDGEIRVTCFNAVADQFYNQIEVGKVYLISKGSVKPAQKAFNHLKNDHEITLDHSSTIQPCFDNDNSIPRQQYHFRPIAEVESMEPNSVLDIIGVVYAISPSSLIKRKNGGDETLKQSLSLKDMSGKSVSLTLWGNFCNLEGQTLQSMLDSGQFPVLAVKSARVYEFNGKSIGTISSSQLIIQPDLPDARKLKEWFDSVGRNAPSVPISRDFVSQTDVYKTISQIKDEKLGTSEKADWITVIGTIWHMKSDNFCYTACPNMNGERKCSKKVMPTEDGKWQCDRCDQIFDECDYRYILLVEIQDHTGSTWTTAFQEGGEQIMGVSAKDLYSLKHEEQDDDRYAEIIRKALFSQFCFKLKVKEETFGEEQRIKSILVSAERIKYLSNTKRLLLEVEKMHKGLSSTTVTYGVNPQLGTVGQQAVLPASHVGHYGSQYGGRINSSMPSGGGNSGASGECFKCHQPGHWARDCPGVGKVPSYGGY